MRKQTPVKTRVMWLRKSFNLAQATLLSCLVAIAVCLIAPVGVLAANADLSRAFKATEKIAEGAIVSADRSKAGYVVLANETEGQPLGVATTAANSLIAINQQSDSIQIAVGGRAVVLVSNLNGDIHTGDLIAASMINGVGAIASRNSKIIGVAQQDFNSNTAGSKKQTVRLAGNNQREVSIGSVPIVIAIGASISNAESGRSGVSGWVSSLMGKQVSVWQIVLAALIAFVGFVALIVLVYGAITSGISAVGRNPLAKPTIFEALSQVMAMVSLIALSSVSLMYLVLRI